MKNIQKHKKSFLYAGLGILAISFIVKWMGAPSYCFLILLCVAIILKSVFLITVISAKGFKPSLWFYFIATGVFMILISMIFKTTFQVAAMHEILFYGAVFLKITGLVLMIFCKKR
ncbi:MAG: hypothetical protein LBF04_03605 [Prevotellaceae bacterium]|jgi:uncharacterized membrane protein HdeD (DUF308 family)|nr:hypothetical protein [Prevotellaceae bacterium]